MWDRFMRKLVRIALPLFLVLVVITLAYLFYDFFTVAVLPFFQ